MHAAHLEAFPCLVSRCETEPLYVLSQFHRLFLTCTFMCIIGVLAREDVYIGYISCREASSCSRPRETLSMMCDLKCTIHYHCVRK